MDEELLESYEEAMDGATAEDAWLEQEPGEPTPQDAEISIEPPGEAFALQRERQRREELAPYMELLRRYPELQDPGRMPPEVAAAIRQGQYPLAAYQDYLLERQRAERRVGLQRDLLRARCPGSAAGFGDGEVDGALAAFDAALYG